MRSNFGGERAALTLIMIVPRFGARSFGPSYYFVTEIDLPMNNGQVIVSRELSDGTKQVEWVFPHFIS